VRLTARPELAGPEAVEAASRVAMEGVDPFTIKELGGWKSLSMVQRYAHLSPSHSRDAIERLASRRREVNVRC